MRASSLLRDALGVEGAVITGVVERTPGTLVLGVRPKKVHDRRCSQCGRKSPWYDQGGGKRRWRALDLGLVRVELEGHARRVNCPKHGVVVAAVPWARPRSRFTRNFEDRIAWLATQASQTAVTLLCGLSWRTVGAIIERVVAEQERRRGSFGDLRRIGIDEKSYRRGHRYVTLVVDHDHPRLVWAAEGRSAQVLRGFFDALGPEASSRIEVVSRDAATWISQVLTERCPQAIQCMDPFHVVAWATAAVEQERRGQARLYTHERDGPRARYVKDTRWILRKGHENLTDRQRDGLAELARLNEPLYKAYLLKEQLRLAMRVGGDEGCAMVTEWVGWALTSGLYHMMAVGRQVADHLASIHAALQHRISNARTEAFNTRLQLINRRAYGFHSAAALIALAMLDLGRMCPPLPTAR